MSWRILRNERGVALISVLLVTLALVAIAAGALMLTSQTSLVNKYHQRQSLLEAAADAGLEEARSKINGTAALYPDTGYSALETNAPVYDAGGTVIPGLRRSLYVGPIGISSGQYGVFGSAVTLVKDQSGNQVVRRLEVVQESFAKFAYFTNVEGSINFGSGDQIFGPVHSNDDISVVAPGATFHGPVATAGTISGKSYATFKQGYSENVSPIAMPQTTALTKLRTQALAGQTAFTSNNNGGSGQAEMRIEFVAIDLNGDLLTNGANEGFIKVYVNADERYVSATRPPSGGASAGTLYLKGENNCGHLHAATFVTAFTDSVANAHPNEPNAASWADQLRSASRRCYLGGDSILQAATPNAGWLTWPGAVSPLVIAAVGPTRAQYLFPISRELNPTFKGVIYVDGKVVISGRLRGRVTLAATNNIIIGDDVTYVTNPGAGTCVDMLGVFSATDVVISDNLINAPSQVENSAADTYVSFDGGDVHEFFHGVILALSNFTVENYNTNPNSGSTGRENCEGTQKGRGCLYLTGGIIQEARGAVGTAGGTGNLKRYSYDACAFSNPPPYFPTTGHFAKGHYFEVDPTGFNIATYFNLLAAGT